MAHASEYAMGELAKSAKGATTKATKGSAEASKPKKKLMMRKSIKTRPHPAGTKIQRVKSKPAKTDGIY